MVPYELKGTIRLGPFEAGRRLVGRASIGTVHPAVRSVRELIPGWADTTVVCPCCPVDGAVAAVLDHLLGQHGLGFHWAAEWLETVDGDLFALAVDCLMSTAGRAEPLHTRS